MIKAEDLNLQKGSGFGYALSKEISDVDSNGFGDFAVGAPFGKEKSAVVLRSRPVMSFTHAVSFRNVPVIDPKVESKALRQHYSVVMFISIPIALLNYFYRVHFGISNQN